MLFALLYLVLRRLFGLAGGSAAMNPSQDVEILVLRHQLKVLRRQAGRPRLRRLDRVFLAAASRVLPRPSWPSFLVGPQTLQRWYRELVRRKWTYRRRMEAGGRPPLDQRARLRATLLASPGPTITHARAGLLVRPAHFSLQGRL